MLQPSYFLYAPISTEESYLANKSRFAPTHLYRDYFIEPACVFLGVPYVSFPYHTGLDDEVIRVGGNESTTGMVYQLTFGIRLSLL